MTGDRTMEECIVARAITGTWLFYAVGGLYLAGPAVALLLMGIVLWRATTPQPDAATPPVSTLPLGGWLWTGGMGMMLVALVIAHFSEALGALSLAKSTIGWVKGWGLFAFFLIPGACLRIRPAVIIRALCWLSVQCLALTPVLVLAALVHLPARLFVSPLQAIGGPGPEFFAVHLYIVDPASGTPRWQFFAPWAPAAGLMGDLMFVAALYEPSRWLKRAALLGAVVICLLTASRMALIFLVTMPPLVWLLTHLGDRRIVGLLGVASMAGGLFADTVLDQLAQAVSAFKGARASSSRVREALGRIAVDRWWDEAILAGHGIVRRGQHIVEFMPIGSHHTWYGLLYVKGVIGALSLAVPLVWTVLEMLLLAQVTALGRLALMLSLLLIFYTFGENLEILTYLFYPAIILLGTAFAEAAARGSSIDAGGHMHRKRPPAVGPGAMASAA